MVKQSRIIEILTGNEAPPPLYAKRYPLGRDRTGDLIWQTIESIAVKDLPCLFYHQKGTII